MRKIPTLAIPLLFVALLLAGCGSSGGTSTPAAGGGRDYGSAATTTAAGGSGPDTAALAERAGLTGTVNVDSFTPRLPSLLINNLKLIARIHDAHLDLLSDVNGLAGHGVADLLRVQVRPLRPDRYLK